MNILVIIPAYNEEKNIENVVNNLINNYSEYDYLVVNDGSSDNTSKICKKNRYNLIDLPINIGLSGAVQAGMKYASIKGYDAAIQFDGDGQHNPEYISIMIEEMKKTNADIVIGSRFKDQKRTCSLRMIGNIVLKTLIKLTTKKTVSDPTSGMRLFNNMIINEFAWNTNYGPEPDTISYLLSNGAIISEVQVDMNMRIAGESYLSFSRSIRYMLQMCISILFIQRFRKRKVL